MTSGCKCLILTCCKQEVPYVHVQILAVLHLVHCEEQLLPNYNTIFNAFLQEEYQKSIYAYHYLCRQIYEKLYFNRNIFHLI